MKDLTSSFWIKAKGILFLLLGTMAAALIVSDNPSLRTVALLALTIWCFCRFYYFAFYVIEKYVDPGYKFSGLWPFAGYLFQSRRKK